jgi:cbb3-type cytochrome oxidase maturation protein
MDLAVYMIIATFAVFGTVAAVMLAWSFSAGQWRDLDHAARIVLVDDDPYPGEPRVDAKGV